MLVVVPRVLGQDLPEVSFTVDQQVGGGTRAGSYFRAEQDRGSARSCL